jgi:Flp pilus assembly secretin CpaC
MRSIFLLFTLPFFGCSPDSTATKIALRAGQTRTISVPRITKVQVFNPRVADVRTHDRGSVTVVGVKAGKTKIEISSGDRTRGYDVVVTGVAPRPQPKPASRFDLMIKLRAGSSRIVTLPRSITKVEVVDPKVADLVSTDRRQFTVVGVGPGRTQIRVSTADRPTVTYRVNVR